MSRAKHSLRAEHCQLEHCELDALRERIAGLGRELEGAHDLHTRHCMRPYCGGWGRA